MPPPLPPQQLDLRQRFSAMRNIPPFLREIWATSKPLTLSSIAIRLIRAFLPIATLYIGKLIIDEAVHLTALGVPGNLPTAWRSGELNHLAWLLGAEFGLAILSDTGRQALVSVSLPVLEETGIIMPGKIIDYTESGTTRRGLVRAVDVSTSFPKVRQTVRIETHV